MPWLPRHFPKHTRSTKCGHTGSGSSSSKKMAFPALIYTLVNDDDVCLSLIIQHKFVDISYIHIEYEIYIYAHKYYIYIPILVYWWFHDIFFLDSNALTKPPAVAWRAGRRQWDANADLENGLRWHATESSRFFLGKIAIDGRNIWGIKMIYWAYIYNI